MRQKERPFLRSLMKISFAETGSPWWDVVKFLGVIGFLTWLTAQGTERLGYHWQWYRVPQFLFKIHEGEFMAGPLLQGVGVTLEITAASLVLSMIIGLVTALFRMSFSPVARILARAYVELIRNTPLLVQLFLIYFVVSPVLDMGRLPSAVLSLSLFEGAYLSEIIRAGILSISRGQWEAAYSLGLGTIDTYRYIIFPVAVRRVLPPMTGQVISLIKDSSLVSTIAIYDLTMRGQAIIAETYLTFEIWFTVAAIYLLMTLTLSVAVHVMENRIRILSV